MRNDLEKSLDVLLEDLMDLKKNEKLLIYGDEGSDSRVIEVTVTIGKRIGAKTTVAYALSDTDLEAVILNADVICDFSERCLYPTKYWKKAIKRGARGYCVGNLSKEAVIRCLGKIDIDKTMEIGKILTEKTRNANIITIRSKSGTDITLGMNRFGIKLNSLLSKSIGSYIYKMSWVREPTGICHNSGEMTFLIGQVSFNAKWGSINGTIAFDVRAPFNLGLVKSPILCMVRDRRITNVIGDREAKIFREWLKNKKASSDIVHFSYGFNPGAKLSGCIVEDERIFGCITVGVGRYPSHSDGVIREPTIQIDGDFIEKNGEYQFPY